MTNQSIFGTGEPLILIHGALVGQAMWQPQIVDFSKHFHVIPHWGVYQARNKPL